MTRICKVLITEDNADVRELLGDLLGYRGYHFSFAENGEQMRQALAVNSIDIVLIDVMLPGSESGFELAKYAADQGYGVILITGDHSHFDRIEKSGHKYLLKPFHMESLIELVEECLRETRARCMGGRTPAA